MIRARECTAGQATVDPFVTGKPGDVKRLRWSVDNVPLGGSDRVVEISFKDPLTCRCARLCHVAGGELQQIQFLLGHVSVETTERYLGSKQKLRHAVNDTMGLEPELG